MDRIGALIILELGVASSPKRRRTDRSAPKNGTNLPAIGAVVAAAKAVAIAIAVTAVTVAGAFGTTTDCDAGAPLGRSSRLLDGKVEGIYAVLHTRADGALGHGCLARFE
jgi:hypothetical protein